MNKKYSDSTCPAFSPWGGCQVREQMAPGIWSVSTASHGGFNLSPERVNDFSLAFPGFEGYAGLPWLEEDCDCCAAIVLWPAEFSPEAVFFSVRMIKDYSKNVAPLDAKEDYFGVVRRWIESPAGAQCRQIASSYEATRKGMWERGGCGTNGNGWDVYVYRNGETKTLHMAEYPSQNWYTDADVSRMEKPEPKPDTVNRVHVSEHVMFNENDCSGVFDGFGVVSDADPGL